MLLINDIEKLFIKITSVLSGQNTTRSQVISAKKKNNSMWFMILIYNIKKEAMSSTYSVLKSGSVGRRYIEGVEVPKPRQKKKMITIANKQTQKQKRRRVRKIMYTYLNIFR